VLKRAASYSLLIVAAVFNHSRTVVSARHTNEIREGGMSKILDLVISCEVTWRTYISENTEIDSVVAVAVLLETTWVIISSRAALGYGMMAYNIPTKSYSCQR
jgi:hypothetical protein